MAGILVIDLTSSPSTSLGLLALLTAIRRMLNVIVICIPQVHISLRGSAQLTHR